MMRRQCWQLVSVVNRSMGKRQPASFSSATTRRGIHTTQQLHNMVTVTLKGHQLASSDKTIVV